MLILRSRLARISSHKCIASLIGMHVCLSVGVGYQMESSYKHLNVANENSHKICVAVQTVDLRRYVLRTIVTHECGFKKKNTKNDPDASPFPSLCKLSRYYCLSFGDSIFFAFDDSRIWASL